MNAVVVELNIESGREDEGIAYLHANVLLARHEADSWIRLGVLVGFKQGQGLTVLVFDDAEAAQAMAGGLTDGPKADFTTLGKIEVRDVVAHIDR